MKHYSMSAEQVKINIVKHIFRILRKNATELISRDRHSNCTKGGKIQNGSRSCQKRKQKKWEKSKKRAVIRDYFRKWRQRPAEIWKGTFSLKSYEKGPLIWAVYFHCFDKTNFWKRKSSRAAPKSRTEFWPRITPGYTFYSPMIQTYLHKTFFFK